MNLLLNFLFIRDKKPLDLKKERTGDPEETSLTGTNNFYFAIMIDSEPNLYFILSPLTSCTIEQLI